MARYRVIRDSKWFRVQRKGGLLWKDIATYFVSHEFDGIDANTKLVKEAIEFMNDAVKAEEMAEEASK